MRTAATVITRDIPWPQVWISNRESPRSVLARLHDLTKEFHVLLATDESNQAQAVAATVDSHGPLKRAVEL
jgi:hypothetical protein